MTDLISGIMADISRAHGREKATKPGEPKKGKDTKNGASPRGSSTRGEKVRDPIPTKSVAADEGSVGTGPTTRQGKPAHNMAAAGGSDATTALGATTGTQEERDTEAAAEPSSQTAREFGELKKTMDGLANLIAGFGSQLSGLKSDMRGLKDHQTAYDAELAEYYAYGADAAGSEAADDGPASDTMPQVTGVARCRTRRGRYQTRMPPPPPKKKRRTSLTPGDATQDGPRGALNSLRQQCGLEKPKTGLGAPEHTKDYPEGSHAHY